MHLRKPWSVYFSILLIHRILVGITESQINSTLVTSLLTPLSEITLLLRTSKDASNGYVKFFLNQTACPVKVMSYNFEEKSENRNNIILTFTSELESVLDEISTRLGTQFFIMEGHFNATSVTDIARSIWNRVGIFKNYYLTLESVYFYNPFVLDLSGTYGSLQNTTDWRDFDDIFQNLNGYPLRTYIFRSVYSRLVRDEATKEILRAEGADAEVAYSIQKVINCKLVLQEPDAAFFGYRLPNGSYDGAIGKAIRYETDVILTGFFVKDYFTQDMEFSVTVYTDKLCCYTAKAKRIPQSILPLFSVKIDMWIGFIGAAFLLSAVWMAFRKFNLWFNKKRGRKTPKVLIKVNWQYLRIISDTWVMWVRSSVSHYPPFSSEKVFVISLCLVSVIFGAIFESSLATVYINPLYYNDINTMKELDESQLKIFIKHVAMKDDLFFGSSSSIFQRLHNKIMLVGDVREKLIEIMSRKGGFASVTRASSLLLDDIEYILFKKIHRIPECPKRYRIAYVFPKESPLKKRINDLLARLLNAGLIDHWIEMMLYEARLTVLKSPELLKAMGGYTWKVLTINDLQLAFYVVIGGSFLSSIVLVSEIYIAKRSRSK